MTEPVLKIEDHGKVRLLTLNRPEVRNALNMDLNDALVQALIEADHDPDVYVIAITGTGTSFCSGADLKGARDMADQGKPFYGPLHNNRRSLMEVMIDTRKPTVGIINGPAMAGGFELALSCDMRVAAPTAFFGVPESKRARGAHFASVMLPVTVPPGIAMEWLYTGRRIPLEEAERWGLVNKVLPGEDVLQEGLDWLGDVISSAPLSLQRLKLTYRKTAGLPPHSAIRMDAGPDVYMSEDQKEGARAFLERREPQWQGR
ncbi:enoyl-CoA hydratase/isomerase family protein [Nocardioides sp. cx-173]|uniref:enoyl-CoA hydratase/isomerase family protein n=1 Tax=Nocardioides sp. cx-173 TaxID=2898796 RepID=UPI001E2D3007|nr:enoyl-CoA hydratase/isomerase family protein [Nocardioides sp. cx-173]MCD4526594.1 enoyl-CoA hydratase/isomerase family protein [Nocardioides sp. cx-173]UGB40689.1 enoyl-CoA hydratase/isomerase family protein [Nocardioides sp. cx-173]